MEICTLDEPLCIQITHDSIVIYNSLNLLRIKYRGLSIVLWLDFINDNIIFIFVNVKIVGHNNANLTIQCDAMLSSSRNTFLKLPKTISSQKLFDYDCITLYLRSEYFKVFS